MSHRRRSGFRGRGRVLAAALLSVFFLVGVFAATGIARDPFATGSAPDTDTDAGAAAQRPTGALPFDLPAAAELRSGGKLVFAHYFTPYPLSLDNASADTDYYTRNYLTPAGENGKHERYGGLLRDRPLPVRPQEGDWELADLRQEVRTARAAGIDGFTLDLLSLSGPNWDRANLLMEAARSVDPAFKVMLMPDMTSLNADDPAVLADALAALGKAPAAHRLGDGRLVVSPFKAEARDVAWWTGVLGLLESKHGIRTAFVPLFLDFGANNARFAPISYGFSEWGSRSYVGQDGATGDVRRAHGTGKIWMQPVSVQDARPNQGIYDEAGNTATLRATWAHAIDDGADWVQLTTWNDYSEGSQFAPSLHNGHTYLDISSYYLARFKTGAWPEIVRDTLYLTSRTQFAAADPTGGQSLLMSPRKGSAAPRDAVEVLSFLTAPATVRTDTGGARGAYRAPGGVHAQLLTLRPGTSSAEAVRDGTTRTAVTLPYAVDRGAGVQDLQYYGATSGRTP
ncbi:glycoside hydrolase family 71 protein [Streptomyces sp. NBC_00536]|uniref:glycoside hydrolase family 71 protein n=1 Tax=Streptomyces sp. NBC_00536 TaxID=2975769 RepID=UPI002E803340|nr:glycoside hydrolase family 71 protein [Streptomyces sp. NBC_00536]WUC82360.1 glycoside hydrolase family 71 protein [Streptomyces sp. NBC_00536]